MKKYWYRQYFIAKVLLLLLTWVLLTCVQAAWYLLQYLIAAYGIVLPLDSGV